VRMGERLLEHIEGEFASAVVGRVLQTES